MPSFALAKLTRDNVSRYHGEGRALACQQRRAKGGVADQSHPSTRPNVHPNLTYAVKIDIIAGIQRGKNPWAFPSDIVELLMEDSLVPCHVMHSGVLIRTVCEDQQEQRAIIAHGEAGDLLARNAMTDIDALVPGSIAFDFERRDSVTKIFLETTLASKHQFADCRVETIGSDNEVEPAWCAAFENNTHIVAGVFNADDAVTENGFALAVDLVID
jgi:hypothetical protein